MNKIILYTLMVLVLSVSNAQNNSICERRMERIATQLSNKIETDDNNLITLEQNISSCYSDSALSYYLQGLFEILKSTNNNYNTAFLNFQNASNQGYPKAITYMAYCYKNGWGIEQDLEVSQAYLEEAAAMGESTAIYSLGYFYLKGLNADQQNYENAKALFEQSDNEMASHWLAINHLFGLGCDQDVDYGVELLEGNSTRNSQNLLEHLNTNDFSNNPLKDLRFSINDITALENMNDVTQEELLGGLYELEWSATKVISEHAFEIEIDNEEHQLSFTLDSTTTTSPYFVSGSNIIPENLLFTLPAFVLDQSDQDDYTYKIEDINWFYDSSNFQYIAKLRTTILELNEPGQPIYINAMTQSLIEEKIANSIQIYPNYFQDTFQIDFTIEKPSIVSLEIYDLNGILKKEIPVTEYLIGDHSIHVEAPELNSGTYACALIVDGTPFGNQIIKHN